MYRLVITLLVSSLIVPSTLEANVQSSSVMAVRADEQGETADPKTPLQRPSRLSVVNTPLPKALVILSERADVAIAFSPTFVPGELRVTCHCEALSVAETLTRLLNGTELVFQLLGDHIVVQTPSAGTLEWRNRTLLASAPDSLALARRQTSSDEREAARSPSPAQAQQGAIRGRVTEAGTARPLGGAQVFVPGTSIGTLAQEDGQYRLTGVPVGSVTVRASLIGYRTGERSVTVVEGEVVTLDFELGEAPLSLDEIIVTGAAGQARRREIGNTVSTIRADEIDDPAVTTDQLLQANAPGMSVLSSSGVMGGGARVRLRGVQSISMSNNPLIYVDGVRIESDGPPKNAAHTTCACESNNDTPSPLNNINPDDIERIEVLRGPSATTLYGTEASAGVIQIFTKKGQSGAPRWTLGTTQSLDWVQAFGSEQHPYLGRPELGLGLDRFLRTAHAQTYNASVSGGSDEVQYFVSGGWDNNEGVLPNDSQDKVMVRSNVTFEPSSGLRFDVNNSLTTDNINNTPAGTNIHGLTANVYRAPNNFIGSGELEDLLETLRYKIGFRNLRFSSGATTHFDPSERLTNRLTIGYDRVESNQFQQRPYDFKFDPGGSMVETEWVNETITLDYVGTYRFELKESFGSSFSWGGQGIIEDERMLQIAGLNFPGVGDFTVSAASQISTLAENRRIVSGGGFVQNIFSLRDRYFLTLGLRVDGNSVFGDDFGLQPYPKASFSYVISDEGFWPTDLGTVKLRGAFGTAGRAPGAFDAVRTWTPQPFGDEPAFIPQNVGDPNLGPERSQEFELGFDGSFLNDRLAVDFTYYNQRTKDALLNVRQVPSMGFVGSQLRNVGELSNKGVEFRANATLIDRSDLVWELGGNLGTNHNKVESLGDAAPFSVGWFTTWIDEGLPAPAMRGTLIRNPDELADPILEFDHIFGPNEPTLNLGITTRLELGRLQLSALGEYAGGHYQYSNMHHRQAISARTWPVCKEADAYTKIAAGDVSGLTARERAMCDPTLQRADMFIFEGDFFKLRWVTAQYELPQGIIPRAKEATFTLSLRNIFRWVKDDYLLADPEMGGDDGVHMTARVIGESFPPPARASASIRLTF